MKRLIAILLIAVLLPSGVLAWLALRSLRGQQYILERQQALLHQEIVDGLSRDVNNLVLGWQTDFAQTLRRLEAESPTPGTTTAPLPRDFDAQIRSALPWVEVGFATDTAGEVFSPQPESGASNGPARRFLRENADFIMNRAPALVFTDQLAQNTLALGAENELTFNDQTAEADGATLGDLRRAAPAEAQVAPSLPAPVSAPEELGRSDQITSFQAAPATRASEKQEKAPPKSSEAKSKTGAALPKTPQVSTASAPQDVEESPAPAPERRRVLSKKDFVERQNALVEQAQERSQPGRQAELELAPQAELMEEAPAAPSRLPEQPEGWSLAPFSRSAANNYRNVSPQKASPQQQQIQVISSVQAVETEFADITRNTAEGVIARLGNAGVNLLLWRRSEVNPEVIYGVQVDGAALLEGAAELVWLDSPLRDQACLTLLNHLGKPAATSDSGFAGDWKRPFVATEIGEFLPYWEAALYLKDSHSIGRSAALVRWSISGLVAVMVGVIAIGAGLVSREVASRMREARQKTDFVSNVSHELKTPLTSIRMFSELLAEDRVQDPTRRTQYLNIIVSEAGRLTRLINNVLDFSRMERGEKRYHLSALRLEDQLREIAGMLSPGLQEQGIRLELDLPGEGDAIPPVQVLADADALAQVWVNLLSNCEKYAAAGKEIRVRLERAPEPGRVRVLVEDRGPGVPRGLEKRIFEQFFRADDSLASAVQGSGLGLTLARQIVQAHRGVLRYEPRPGGGSRFIVELPTIPTP